MAKRSVTHLIHDSMAMKDEQYVDADNEWHTPYWLMIMVREMLGGIELDPASSFVANISVKADRYYDKEQNGLFQPWCARTVWCNPPFGRAANNLGYVGAFMKKALQEYKNGHAKEIIILTPVNATTAYYFEVLGTYPLCMVRKSVWFMQPHKKQRDLANKNKNMMGTMLTYMGPNNERFTEIFRTIGAIILPEGVINDQQVG